jgi:pimeloyl-ACP methyl ester carboxylesterase
MAMIGEPRSACAYAALRPGAKFEVIAAAGHYPHLEQPDHFRKAVSGFLGRRKATP